MRFLHIAIAVSITTPLRAQTSTSTAGNAAAADSAAVARLAWQRAGDALRKSDTVAARREVEHAATAWPTQEAYAWGRAVLAARAHDTAAVARALAAYAELGLGRDIAHESAMASFASLPAFARLIAQHDANRAPIARGTVRASLPDSTFWPEGMDFDAKHGRYYVASIRYGTIAEITPGAPPREIMPRHLPNIGAIFGVRVDTARGVLWATTSGLPLTEGYAPRDSAIAALLMIRIADGHIMRRWDLPPSPNGHTLGDLSVGSDGTVYVTDSSDPVLYALAPRGDSLVAFRHPLFRSLQGIAPVPGGRVVYVADYSHGILRVDLATRTVTRVADAPRMVSLGCDGIAWDRGAIVAVQNGVTPARIMRFVLSSDGMRFVRSEVLDRNTAIADEPTIGAIVGRDFVYVANSQWDKYTDAGTRTPDTRLKPPVLIAVPLPR